MDALITDCRNRLVMLWKLLVTDIYIMYLNIVFFARIVPQIISKENTP